MSALPPKADSRSQSQNVRFGPEADKVPRSKSTATRSPRRRSPAPSPAAQPLRHQHDGLAVDLGVIPLTHRHLEIRRARGKRRAGPPAIGLEQIGGRGQHIWNGMAQIDMAVAVVVDAVLDV